MILTGSRLLPISADGSERPCEVLIGCIMSARIAGSRGLHWYKDDIDCAHIARHVLVRRVCTMRLEFVRADRSEENPILQATNEGSTDLWKRRSRPRWGSLGEFGSGSPSR